MWVYEVFFLLIDMFFLGIKWVKFELGIYFFFLWILCCVFVICGEIFYKIEIIIGCFFLRLKWFVIISDVLKFFEIMIKDIKYLILIIC